MKSKIVKRLQLNAKFSNGFSSVEVSIKDVDTGAVQVSIVPIQLKAIKDSYKPELTDDNNMPESESCEPNADITAEDDSTTVIEEEEVTDND